MAQDGTWVDHIFVQMIAWYMELDLLIVTTSSQPDNPFIFISGNINNIPAPDSIPPLLLGNYTNVHYQSLLLETGQMTSGKEQVSRRQIVSQEQKTEEFIFMQNEYLKFWKAVNTNALSADNSSPVSANI